MLKFVLLPILFFAAVAAADVVNLPGEYHYGLSFEVYKGKPVPEVNYVDVAMKKADEYCNSLGGQKRYAFFYEKEMKDKEVTVRLTETFCGTAAKNNDNNSDARRIIFAARVARGQKINAEQRIVLEKRNTTYSGYKTVDAAKLQGAAGGTGKVQAEPAKK